MNSLAISLQSIVKHYKYTLHFIIYTVKIQYSTIRQNSREKEDWKSESD
jgi:hypothetical protein